MVRNAACSPWSLAEQRKRIALINRAVCREAIGYFDAEGRCRFEGTRHHVGLREHMHFCSALLTGAAAEIELANRIIAGATLAPCDFSTLTMVELLLRHSDRVTSANTRRLQDHIAHEVTSVERPHNAFVGYNDNFPAMATAIMVLGGELVGSDHAVQAGIDSLCAARDLLTRRGFYSEYNSPTYAAVTLRALGDIAGRARNRTARRLAQQAAYRMWIDIASHWHPSTSFQAGPQSRAYHVDSTLISAHTASVMWVVFGDRVWPSPLQRYFGPAAEQSFEHVVHRIVYMQSALPGYCSTPHRVDQAIDDLAFAKRYPFGVRGKVEGGVFHTGAYRLNEHGAPVHVPGQSLDFPAAPAILSTHMERNFAIGTATRGMCNGAQTELFSALYRRRPRGRTLSHIRSVFARYLVGSDPLEPAIASGLIANQALGFAIQDARRALALYHPAGGKRQDVDSLRLCLMLNEQEAPVDGIWIGDRQLPNGDGENVAGDWTIIRDGTIWLAFMPLVASNLGRAVAIRSEHTAGLRVISFYNYQGAPRDFEHDELRRIGAGFAFEVSTTRQHPTVADLLRDLRRAEVSDSNLMETRRVRYMRGRRELMLWLDPANQSLKSAAINGCELDPPPLDIDGFDMSRVPWLGRGPVHRDLAWWHRINARPGVPGLEGLSGYKADR